MNRKYNDSQIIELHSAGLTDREIAETLGVSPNNLATKRRKLGLTPNKSKRDTYKLTKKELEMISQGKLAAQSLGLPSSNVQDIALTYMAVHKYENTYNNIAEAVNKKDRMKYLRKRLEDRFM